MNRAQSDSTGVVLLTAVIGLTIISSGGVVMGTWQSNIDQQPVADIESEITSVAVSLEHRGGDTLYPHNTTIYLAGVDETITLSEPLKPGTNLYQELDMLSGTIELLVVYDPEETVVYRETYRIDNPT